MIEKIYFGIRNNNAQTNSQKIINSSPWILTEKFDFDTYAKGEKGLGIDYINKSSIFFRNQDEAFKHLAIIQHCNIQPDDKKVRLLFTCDENSTLNGMYLARLLPNPSSKEGSIWHFSIVRSVYSSKNDGSLFFFDFNFSPLPEYEAYHSKNPITSIEEKVRAELTIAKKEKSGEQLKQSRHAILFPHLSESNLLKRSYIDYYSKGDISEDHFSEARSAAQMLFETNDVPNKCVACFALASALSKGGRLKSDAEEIIASIAMAIDEKFINNELRPFKISSVYPGYNDASFEPHKQKFIASYNEISKSKNTHVIEPPKKPTSKLVSSEPNTYNPPVSMHFKPVPPSTSPDIPSITQNQSDKILAIPSIIPKK